MRWSNLFIPTLRDDPVEAEAPSHKLLVRGGFVRQLMAGHYSLLPLGMRVRNKVVAIIREEMDAIGAQEFLLPGMHPVDIWEKTGRRNSIDVMFTLTNRRNEEMVLGPTHEEIFTTIFSEVQSYKDLPQSWYQFQTKFRDETRAKGGLLRVREFTMKDSYSFDADEAGLDASFEKHRAAYVRIFERLGIPAMQVQASNGSMGGKDSIEFMSEARVGEDEVIGCNNCGYAANVERAVAAIEPFDDGAERNEIERFDTPNVKTIADLMSFDADATAQRQIKTLVYVVDGEIMLVLLRGDHELVEQKLVDTTGTIHLRAAHADEIKSALGALPGSLGAARVEGYKIIADEALRGRYNMFTGANTDDVHLKGVDIDRDIEVDEFVDLRRVVKDEACSVCNSKLDVVSAIEVGHIFKLGQKFTRALNATVLGRDGKPIVPMMGCYGIGVERAIASVVERFNDDKGIIWPRAIAPFDVAVIALNSNDAETMKAAEDIYAGLQVKGHDVILDDRDARPGVKLSDVELIGIPWRVIVGKRGLANGVVEITERATGKTREVAIVEAVDAVRFG